MPGIVRQIYDAGRMAAARPALGEAVPISPVPGSDKQGSTESSMYTPSEEYALSFQMTQADVTKMLEAGQGIAKSFWYLCYGASGTMYFLKSNLYISLKIGRKVEAI